MRVEGFVPVTGSVSNNGSDVLSKLKPGETVRAQVLENSGSELTLKFSDGSKVSASAMSPVAADNGEFVNFVYKGTIDGKPAFEVASINTQPQVDTSLENIRNALTGLNLPVTEQNIELAQALKQQNVPITAESMSQVIDLVSKNNGVKPNAAAFLTATNMSDKNSIEKLQNLLAGRLKIGSDISDLLKLISSDENNSNVEIKTTEVNNILQKLAAQLATKATNQSNTNIPLNKDGAISSNANNAANTIATSTQNANVTNSANTNSLTSSNQNTITSSNSNINASNLTVVNTISNGENANTSRSADISTIGSNLNATNSTDISTKNSNSNSANVNNIAKSIDGASRNAALANSTQINSGINTDVNSTFGGNLKNANNIFEQISSIFKDGTTLGKADLPLLNSLNFQLESMLNAGDMSTEEKTAAKLIAKEINVEMFKIHGSMVASDQVSSDAKSLKLFQDAVNNLKIFFVKVDQNSDEINPVKLYRDIDNSLQVLKNSIMQLPSSMREAAMSIANNLESNVNFINQLNNYSSYVQIPLSIFNQNTTGELYMLKKGSKSRKLDPSNMTVLLSLDTNNIGRIDTLLSIDKKNISTNFRLENSDVFNVLKENHKQLYKSLLEKGYRLVDFTYRLMEEPINIVNFEAEAKKEFIKSPNQIDIMI